MDRPELLCVPRAALDYITELETELAEVKALAQAVVDAHNNPPAGQDCDNFTDTLDALAKRMEGE